MEQDEKILKHVTNLLDQAGYTCVKMKESDQKNDEMRCIKIISPK